MAATQVSPTAAREIPVLAGQDFTFEMWFAPGQKAANESHVSPVPHSLIATTIKVGDRSLHHLSQGQLQLINSSSQAQ